MVCGAVRMANADGCGSEVLPGWVRHDVGGEVVALCGLPDRVDERPATVDYK